VICTWTDADAPATLTASFGLPEGSVATYIDETKALDIAEEVTVAGADDAVAVTITSGSGASRTTRVALVAKVGRDQLTVVLVARRVSLDTVVAIAELAVAA
jgi:hypothetical protein